MIKELQCPHCAKELGIVHAIFIKPLKIYCKCGKFSYILSKPSGEYRHKLKFSITK